jgi:hypothetical protein
MMIERTRRAFLGIGAFLVLFASVSFAADPVSSAALRIAIVGHPLVEGRWTDESLERLKAIGFNAVQLNIAWGTRPFDEVLNLADVVSLPGQAEVPRAAERRTELKRRVALAQKHGLRTLFHFGSPYRHYNPYTGEVYDRYHDVRFTSGGAVGLPQSAHVDDVTYDSWYDVLNPKVRDHEVALLREFRREFPTVDDILVYTFDQDAWQTPEYQYTQHSYAIPLAERLPGYLAALHAVWTEGRRGRARLWWEPWELSAGQTFATLPKLPRSDFGLILHSNIAEVQLAVPVDPWLRNTARMARDLGIPVIAEGFFSSTHEEIEPLSLPSPRLVDEQYLALMGVPGVLGIKEYYGIDTSAADLNVEVLQARIRSPARSTDELIEEITQRFGPSQADVRAYLGLLSDALQVYPWDASWTARRAGIGSIDHGWSAATVRGVTFDSPAWKSTRLGKFMRTDNSQPHFWLLEDVGLRCQLTADLLDQATALSPKLLASLGNPRDRSDFERIQKDVETLRRISRSYALHIRETNVAQMLRQDLDAGREMTPKLLEELGRLLDADVTNQQGKGRVLEMKRLYRVDSKAFVRRYLLPTDVTRGERGSFTLTTR